MPSNRAAWLVAKNAPLEIKEAPYTLPGPDQVVVKNAAVAINPVDYTVPGAVDMMAPWIKLPHILGTDVAGTVVQVGQGVTLFKPGDRVLGCALSFDKRANNASEGGFQEYTVLRTNMTSRIPEWMSFESASVLPVCLCTAACALFQKDLLGLQLPTATTPPKSTGETLLVWGGSTSVGCNAIQLAVAAGYEVITTASPRNYEYLKKLGASEVFDYKSPTVVQDITAAFNDNGKTAAGALAIGVGAMSACIDILGSTKGKKFIAQASYEIPIDGAQRSLLSMVWTMASSFVYLKTKGFVKGVGYKFIWCLDIMASEVGAAIYNDFLPVALAEKKYVAAPEPQVAGKGLEEIEKAFEVLKKGVSAKKIVVSL